MEQVHGVADMSYGTNVPHELDLISEGVGYGREFLPLGSDLAGSMSYA